ncbi:hypothetical protein BAUCODRAFT_150800 [Baudoinia panamericana UAMH 10762]|uniref:CENP-V/GFA domain-containing protein n=1 Tax=Baudoinia panamericana (strain UAMH 10762) TaxID=717646 RepID=M2MPV5_BAUPA|nr:uncharacterized protein BAUCODRAFT_150800 [Baudoinia panamericana UAMH 10762]EMC93478.1 hypothetical protein BAUCODRAFT_150800 [Baudoinia panamericana UAMH 10762]
MPTGSCLCGDIKVSYTGDPPYTSICYCDDCRKIGLAQLFPIPEDSFTFDFGKDKVKVHTKVADSGFDVSTHFCPSCSVALYRTSTKPSFQGIIGLRAGVIDDQSIVNAATPKLEIFAERRPIYIDPIPGTQRVNCRFEKID